jgi:AcrR family transcriptional regulator
MTHPLRASGLADSSPDEVRAKLIATATELYGARGTHAVSAREIQRAAGVLNEAAVRYYFGDKLGLLSACSGTNWTTKSVCRE